MKRRAFIALVGGAAAAASIATPTPLAAQPDLLGTYDKAVSDFKSVLGQRRAQIDAKQPLPNLPGQELYLARNKMMSAYKDLTDAVPAKIGKPNKYGIPPAYFEADNEPLLDEYYSLIGVMEAPPADAQVSDTPFQDVVDLATAIGRAKGLDAANADVAGRIGVAIFFAETSGHQNAGNSRSNTYKGSFQTGPSEDQDGRKKWAAIKPIDRGLRSGAERARRPRRGAGRQARSAVQPLDRRAERPDERPRRSVPADPGDRRDAARSDRSDEAVRADPDHSEPDQARLSNRAASPDTEISEPRIMGYLRNNSVFTFGQADRAKASANFREILDAMWLFNVKFEQALAKFNEIKAGQKG